MGRKGVCCLVITGLILSLAAPVFADDAMKKLGRGVCNIASCPLEILMQMDRVNNSDGPLAGCTWGFAKGAGMMLWRCVIGVYETVSFPFPMPKDYKPILTDPEFFFEQYSW